MRRMGCLEQMVRGMTQVLSRPLTLKMRTAVYHDTKVAHNLVQRAKLWDISMVTVSVVWPDMVVGRWSSVCGVVQDDDEVECNMVQFGAVWASVFEG